MIPFMPQLNQLLKSKCDFGNIHSIWSLYPKHYFGIERLKRETLSSLELAILWALVICQVLSTS